MKMNVKHLPLTVEEVKAMIKKENSSKAVWAGIVIGVIVALVGVIIWLAKRSCKDIEEHYEYFDDVYEDNDDSESYDDFDEDIYEDEEVEYVKIKDFMNYAEDEKHASEEAEKVEEDAQDTL